MDNLKAFNNKKVLLVCAETFSWPMHYVARNIREHCKSLSAIYIQPGESYFNAPDFELFKSLNKDINIFEMSSVVEDYMELYKSSEANLDWEYIRYIEAEYTTFSSINEQLLSEMMLTPYYHDRFYYEDISYEKTLLYVQFYYKYIEDLFKSNKPDLILDADVDFFGRTVLLEVSKKFNVPYISLDHARLDGFILPTNSLVKKRDKIIEKLFLEYAKDDSILEDQLIAEAYYQNKENIGGIPVIFKKMHAEHAFSVKSMLKQLAINTYVGLRHQSLKKLRMNIFLRLSTPIASNTIKSFKHMFLYYIRRFYLHYSNIFDNVDLKEINYIFVPLHVIPESSTTILSPYYINETFIIESLSKSIRADQKILIKEHWSMIGYRPISYYKKIKRISNVVLVNPASNLLPSDYIQNSDLVATISGSSAFEAAMMEKNSIVFSDVVFGMLSSVKKVYVDSSLKNKIREQLNYKMPKKELYAYIKILYQFGKKVMLKNLLAPPSRTNEKEIEQDVANLVDIYVHGLELYEKRVNNDEI